MKKDKDLTKDLIKLSKLSKKDLLKIIREYRFTFQRYDKLLVRSYCCLSKLDGFDSLLLLNDLRFELMQDLIIRK